MADDAPFTVASFQEVPITVVWSSYGHEFLTGDDRGVCQICGATYNLVHDDPEYPAHGAYQASNGDEPFYCSGNINMDHGDERTTDTPCNCIVCQ